MKAAALALCLLCAPALAEEYIARNGSDTVRITDGPCAVDVLKLLPEGTRGYYRGASAIVDGKSYVACWVPFGGANVFVIYEDGDQALIPMSDFEHSPGT